MHPGQEITPRSGKALIDASRPFAQESPGRSWWLTLSTFALISALTAAAAFSPHWSLRLLAGVINGLLLVRGFILYHDHMHGALLRKSPVARACFAVYGTFLLTPPRVWRQTHNYHHANTARIVGSHIGSYPVATVDMWLGMTLAERLIYRITRHPLNLLLAPLTIFAYGMCIASFLRSPKKYWDSLASVLLHAGLATAIISSAGLTMYVFCLLLPLWLATVTGGYLFYAQHNFPDMHLLPREEWSYTHAALHSSSYLRGGALMHWFTGNIGYHHVHHLNSMIPFYRLPEAMAGIHELQDPHETSLWPRDVIACFALKLWDPQAQRMVGFP